MADDTLPLHPSERKDCFNFVKFTTVNASNSPIEQGIDIAPKELEDTQDTQNKIEISHEDVSTKARTVQITDKVKLDDTKPSNTKIKHNSPRNRSKYSVKQKTLTSPRHIQTTPEKQAKSKADKLVNGRIDDNQQHEKQISDNCIIVNHSPTSCTIKMNSKANAPESGKRKRGRPPKKASALIDNKKEEEAAAPAKKAKIEKRSPLVNALPSRIRSPSGESEKSDGASDTNSTSSIDTETRRYSSKAKEYVCAVCEKADNLLFCKGVCNNAYHKDCLTYDVLSEKFVCDQCTSGNHKCFVCNKTENVIKCSSQHCGKFYHIDCVKMFDSKIDTENFLCPLHHCNVCGSNKTSNSKRRLTSCIRCPVAYHSATCVVAGSLPINSQYLVCNRHFMADPKKAHHSHVNVNWCFVCSIGGTLICCDSCPAAFHPECIQETGIPEGRFFCRDCKDGKEMLYGEIVWVKLGMYRYELIFYSNSSVASFFTSEISHQYSNCNFGQSPCALYNARHSTLFKTILC